MKNKKVFLIGLILIVIMVILAMAFITFSVKKIDITYNCAEEVEQTSEIEKEMEVFRGKNLVFISEDEIGAVLEKFPLFEIERVEKKYPSELIVVVKERHKAFFVEIDGKKTVLSDNGTVLSTDADEVAGLVKLDFSGDEEKYIDSIEVIGVKVGEKLCTDHDGFLDIFFDMAKTISAVDCIDEANINVKSALNSFDVEFITNTKMTLFVSEAEDDGREKSRLALSAFDNETLDFKKSSENDRVLVYKDKEGKIQVDFSQK